MKTAKLLMLGAALALFTAPMAGAVGIGIDEVIYQPDPTLNPSDLGASAEFNAIDADSFEIRLTNTTGIFTPFETATVLLTGIGFNLPQGYFIIGGDVSDVNAMNFDTVNDDMANYWGSDNSPLNSGPFLNIASLSVNTAVSTLSASVEPGGVFGSSPGNVNGPKHGIASLGYGSLLNSNYPYIYGTAFITVDLNAGVADWDAFFAGIDSEDVVVSFGSPVSSAVPEPSTLLLLGGGLLGIAALRRRMR